MLCYVQLHTLRKSANSSSRTLKNVRNTQKLFLRFPKPQDEAWFLVLGNVEDNQDILALKRVNTIRGGSPTTQQLTFWTPEVTGRVILTLYVMSDSYIGLDQQYDIHLEVV